MQVDSREDGRIAAHCKLYSGEKETKEERAGRRSADPNEPLLGLAVDVLTRLGREEEPEFG